MPFRFRSLSAAIVALATAAIVVAGPVSATPSGPSHIIGGSDATIESVPWQVGLLSPSDVGAQYDAQFCGGSIINEHWVVTAAHCLDDYGHETLDIFAGSADLDVPAGQFEYHSTRWIVHPGYTDWYHDIALVHVDDPFDLSGVTMNAITLPFALNGDTAPAINDSVTISGWGEEIEYQGGNYPTQLKMATVQVLAVAPTDVCGDYDSTDWNYRYEMCVGTVAGGIDTCQGDSGGPYATTTLDGDGDGLPEPTLVGVTSWGNGCASADYPGFATRTTSYLDWIVPRPPVVNVTYFPGSSKHRITWKRAKHQLLSTPIRRYRIEYSDDSGATWNFAASVSRKTFTYVATAPSGRVWRVAAMNDVNKNLGPYAWADASGPLVDRGATKPSVPLDFAVDVVNSRRLDITWDEPTLIGGSAISGYRVYRKIGGSRPVLVGQTIGTDTEVRIRRTGRSGTFWVVAVNNLGASPASNTFYGH